MADSRHPRRRHARGARALARGAAGLSRSGSVDPPRQNASASSRSSCSERSAAQAEQHPLAGLGRADQRAPCGERRGDRADLLGQLEDFARPGDRQVLAFAHAALEREAPRLHAQVVGGARDRDRIVPDQWVRIAPSVAGDLQHQVVLEARDRVVERHVRAARLAQQHRHVVVHARRRGPRARLPTARIDTGSPWRAMYQSARSK